VVAVGTDFRSVSFECCVTWQVVVVVDAVPHAHWIQVALSCAQLASACVFLSIDYVYGCMACNMACS
jgi:hypothetical protein